jgi:hypothetical protein
LSSSPAIPSSLLLSAPERVCWGVGWEVEGAGGRFWGLLVGSLLEEAASVSMDEESEVIRLEALCKELYESHDAAARAEAEKALVSFQNSPESLGKCQRLLDRGNSPYAQLLATTTITKLISRSTGSLTLQQRRDIRNYVLTYLWSQPKLPQFVVQGLVTLFFANHQAGLVRQRERGVCLQSSHH